MVRIALFILYFLSLLTYYQYTFIIYLHTYSQTSIVCISFDSHTIALPIRNSLILTPLIGLVLSVQIRQKHVRFSQQCLSPGYA